MQNYLCREAHTFLLCHLVACPSPPAHLWGARRCLLTKVGILLPLKTTHGPIHLEKLLGCQRNPVVSTSSFPIFQNQKLDCLTPEFSSDSLLGVTPWVKSWHCHPKQDATKSTKRCHAWPGGSRSRLTRCCFIHQWLGTTSRALSIEETALMQALFLNIRLSGLDCVHFLVSFLEKRSLLFQQRVIAVGMKVAVTALGGHTTIQFSCLERSLCTLKLCVFLPCNQYIL